MSLERLRPFHSKERIEEWRALAAAELHHDLARALIISHYDPLYQKSRKRCLSTSLATVRADDLRDAGIERATSDIAAIIARLSKRLPP
jgi:tRNA 2-selenouridine synthase